MTQQFHSWVMSKKKPQSTNLKRYTYPSVHSSIYNLQGMEVSINQWIKEMSHIYTMEYFSSIQSLSHFQLFVTP